MNKGRGLVSLALALLGALPLGCASEITVRNVTKPLITGPAALVAGHSLKVAVRIPKRMRTKVASPAYTAADVTSVVLRLYSKDMSHSTFDYEGAGSVLFTSTSAGAYTWSGGLDASGNQKYTILNLPASATDYIVTGHAFQGATDITKTVGGFAYGRSSNSVQISTGATTYSDSGSAVLLDLPLQDGVGGDVDVRSTVVDGVEPTPTGGDDW